MSSKRKPIQTVKGESNLEKFVREQEAQQGLPLPDLFIQPPQPIINQESIGSATNRNISNKFDGLNQQNYTYMFQDPNLGYGLPTSNSFVKMNSIGEFNNTYGRLGSIRRQGSSQFSRAASINQTPIDYSQEKKLQPMLSYTQNLSNFHENLHQDKRGRNEVTINVNFGDAKNLLQANTQQQPTRTAGNTFKSSFTKELIPVQTIQSVPVRKVAPAQLAPPVQKKPAKKEVNSVSQSQISQVDIDESHSQITQKGANKRGRKLTEEDKYKQESEKKITDLSNKLKDKKLTVAQRQKIRNQISAQQSRLKKKEEFSSLLKTHTATLEYFKQFVQVLDAEVKGEQRYNVAQKLFEKLPDSSEFEEMPSIGMSNSENIGLTGLQRTRSRGRVIGNLLPGDEAVKRPFDKKRVEKEFTKLINKFMRLI